MTSPFTSQGLIRELAEFTIRGNDGDIIKEFNPDWCETLACTLVSTMIGQERYLSNDFGKIYGNIFCIYVGASGLGFKTVPLKKVVRPTLKQLTIRLNEREAHAIEMDVGSIRDKLRQMKKATSRNKEYNEERAKLESVLNKLVDFEAPQKFTSEFLYSWLTDFPQGMIAGDEYTKMFRGSKRKDWLSDNMEDLSRLYDCDPEKVGTQSRGVEYPENAFISFVSATTYYLLTIMDDDFFIQGTGNRILWILDENREEINVDEEAMKANFWWGIKDDKAFYQEHNNLIEKLLKIQLLPEGLILIEPEASVILDKYRLTKWNEAIRIFNKNRLNMDANFISRLAQNAMKLALIHCVGRYVLDDIDTQQMEVNQYDAQWAIDKMERHFNYYIEMMRLAPEIRKSHTKNYRNDQERVLYWIDEFEKKGKKITFTGLMDQTSWMREDLQKILESLVLTKKIKTVEGRIYAGKRITHYVRGDVQ